MRKKVGLITMHRVVNYGSFLQAYATQYAIEKLGYSCDIIDYQFPNEFHLRHKKSLKSRVIKFLDPLRPSVKKRNFKKKMIRKYLEMLNLSKYYENQSALLNSNLEYDIYITGSDQTWNPKHMKGDEVFMLSFAPKKSLKIAFSACVSDNSLDPCMYVKYKKYLSEYSAISLRDTSSIKLIEELSGVRPTNTLDPTLLLSKKEWMRNFTAERFNGKKYILLYMLKYSFEPQPYIYKILSSLQEETNLEILSLTPIKSTYIRNYKLNLTEVKDITIDDFLSLFANASYVVTSSFHGTAFAVNFEVPLYSVVPNSTSDNRQVDFLRSVFWEESIFRTNDPFRIISTHSCSDKVDKLRGESFSILDEMLKIEKQ